MKTSRWGLSIVEILIIIVILGILFSIAYPHIKRIAGGRTVPARLVWVTPADSALASEAPSEMAVRAEDAGGKPVAGVPVEFQAQAGERELMRGTATTDSSGVARTTWRFGTDAPRVSLSARVGGHPEVSSAKAAVVGGASAGTVPVAPATAP